MQSCRAIFTVLALSAAVSFPPPCPAAAPEMARPKPLGLTVPQALKKYGPEARKRLIQRFKERGAPYPPAKITLVTLKAERSLLLFAPGPDGKYLKMAEYPLVSYSGYLGPKLKEGDLQIPEGFYRPTYLDASTHLCFWVDYPNAADRANAKIEKRTKLGGDIQVHEGVFSTGCVVVDHEPMADIFVLANDIGLSNVRLIISPCNFKLGDPQMDFSKQPKWLPGLYKDLKEALKAYPLN